MKPFWMTIAREGDGAGAGGGGADPGAGGGGGGGGAPDFIPQGLELPADVIGADAPTTIGNLYTRLQEAGKPPYDPDKLGDEYKGKQPTEVFDLMSKRIEGLRAELGRKGEVPKDIEGYAYEPSEKAAQFFRTGPNGEPDPMLQVARQVALDAGITTQAFGAFLNGFLEKGLDGGMVAQPINPKAEIAAFGKALNLPDETAAARKVDELKSFGKSFAEQFKLPENAAVELDILTDTAGGLQALAAIQTALIERGLDLGGQPAHGKTMSDAEFEKLGGSDTIDPMSPNYDAEARKRWEIESNRRADLKAAQRRAS